MADSAVAITPGSGANVDTRTEASNGNHRQVVVIGDPATNAGVAPVDVTNGLAVDVKQSALPSGAATSAKQDTIIGHLDGVEGVLATIDADTGNMATSLSVLDDWDNAASDGVSVSGDVADDAADAGEPVKIGGKALTSERTAVSNNDRVNAWFDTAGRMIMRLNSLLEDLVSGNASNTDGSSTQVIATSGAGVKTYITDVTITNMSSSGIYVELKDGTTVKWTFPVPANGGVTHHFASPLAGTANTAWNFDPSAATTTVYCSAAGFKSKI